MIKVNVTYKNDLIESVEISGHSGYDVQGRDIVCSAVSTASIISINAIISLGYKDNIDVIVKDEGYIKVTVNKDDKVINTLLENLINSLDELMQQYKAFIKINK